MHFMSLCILYSKQRKRSIQKWSHKIRDQSQNAEHREAEISRIPRSRDYQDSAQHYVRVRDHYEGAY